MPFCMKNPSQPVLVAGAMSYIPMDAATSGTLSTMADKKPMTTLMAYTSPMVSRSQAAAVIKWPISCNEATPTGCPKRTAQRQSQSCAERHHRQLVPVFVVLAAVNDLGDDPHHAQRKHHAHEGRKVRYRFEYGHEQKTSHPMMNTNFAPR